MWTNDLMLKCRKAAAEGAVLLENKDNVLPLKKDKVAAFFGRTQIDYYRSGTGSGGAVKAPYTVNLIEGLRNQQACINEELLSIYESWIKENPFNNGDGGWASEPWYQKEMPITDELAKNISSTSDTAVIVIGRTAGEDKDNKPEKGSYYLTDDEYQMMETICANFKNVVVVLNVSNIIDMSWMTDEKIKSSVKSVIYAWHGGMEGGNGIAGILYGAETPSGKLPDTIAYKIENYPSHNGFSDESAIIYKDDIYVGYRYFETFHPEYVQYSFGYGLSYTDFSIAPISAETDGETVLVTVRVANTGDTYAGKETVQLYYEAPQGKLGKAKKVLGGFAKTKNIMPGESQDVSIAISLAEMASYDDSGVTGNKYCYVLESGMYKIYIGNSVKNASTVKINGEEGIFIAETKIVSQLEAVMQPTELYERIKPGALKPDGTYEEKHEPVPQNTNILRERINKRCPKEITFTGNKGYTLQDVKSGKVSLEDFTAQLTDEEMATIVRGEGMSSLQVTAETAAAFGGLSTELKKYKIPVACAADGPSGVRMEANAILLPIGTLLASTWNTELVEELYEFIGKELKENNVDMLLGPGMNIHRNPLNGRNFEYYSEDPLITGKFASAMTKGLSKHGAMATLKHFACNNREHNRNYVNAIVSERALREIYLKGFEIAVKEGSVCSIMTSYNPINGHYTASNYDLNTTVLRNEWGYEGLVMTDWWAKVNNVFDGGEPNVIYLSNMIKAQNDLYMVVENNGAVININEDNILSALKSGELARGELQRSVMNILKVLTKTFAYNNNNLYKDLSQHIEPLTDYDGESVIISDTNNELNICNNKPFYVKISTAGEYSIILVYRLHKPNIAQSRGAYIINNNGHSMILMNGSEGADKEKFLLKAKLSAGIYKFMLGNWEEKLEFTKLYFNRNTSK